MNHWWCMGCETQVRLDKHGQCETCGSEAVDFMEEPEDVSTSISIGSHDLKVFITCPGV